MDIVRFINSVFSSNTYLISDGGEALVVDPGDAEPILTFLKCNAIKLKTVVLTHTHYDHIYGLPAIIEKYPDVKIFTSEFGKKALARTDWNFSRYHDDPISIDSDNVTVIHDGDIIRLSDGFQLKVMETPGHDMSCLSFRNDEMIITGDSYIPGVKVVASFPKSDRELAKKWYSELERMSRDYQVFPGHGEINKN